jgi:NTP pyrophosphatase (non-canonical NTP hydrolase)
VSNEFSYLQYDQITPWTDRNFPNDTRVTATLGLTEEVGELARAALKQWQGLRGTAEEWDKEAAKEIGDVFIKLVHIAHLFQFDLYGCVTARWEEISRRDWTVDKTGHGEGLPLDSRTLVAGPRLWPSALRRLHVYANW